MNNIKGFFFLPLVVLSCATTMDVERVVRSSTGTGTQYDPESAIIAVPFESEMPEPIIIEKPVFIPLEEPPPASVQGRAAVQAATSQGIVQPRDYSNAAMIYDYDRNFVFELYCQPFRISDIILQPGERAVEAPFISDSERWMLGAGISYESGIVVQHIYVKPAAANLEATLIINTDLRVYYLLLRSFSNIHMPIVRWRYHDNVMPQNYVKSSPDAVSGAAATVRAYGDESAFFTDPRFLSFNYRITYGIFRKPRWLPTLVYDDGKKTYIAFPEAVLTGELPAVFENRADIVNYRIVQNILIIDKLVEKITIKLGDRIATIEKKRGK